MATLPGDTVAGTATFTYDTLNQLATAALPMQTAQAYAYDAAHDRCLVARSAAASPPRAPAPLL